MRLPLQRPSAKTWAILTQAALNCAPCHGAVDAPAGAPAFATIASMPSTTADGLNVFLQAPHATMPNLVLSPSDRSDLIAYILSLRP